MESPFSLKNKTLLVTGASSGIGRACAVECAKAGARIVAAGRDETRLGETFSALAGAGHAIVAADISDDAGLGKIVSAVASPLDGIVHCAGISKLRPFAFSAPKNLDAAWRTNALAPVELTRLLLKKNLLAGGASVVFVASISGRNIAALGQTAYAASKAALCGAAKAMALELSAQKIRVNCICPGAVATPIHKLSGMSDEQIAADKKNYPLARYGTPEEIAYAAIYLLSDAAAWTTGAELVIDGGRTLL